MVKGSLHVVLDAHYESASRTLPVSQKMTEGMPIVPVVQVSGKHMAQFDAERLIHGKIREYTLRSAAHWNQVNKVVSHSAAVSQAASINQQSNKVMSADDFTLIAQSIPVSALHALGFPTIQKGLREFVLAHLVRNAVDVSGMRVDGIASSSNHIGVSHFAGASKTGLHHLFSDVSPSNIVGKLVCGLNQGSPSNLTEKRFSGAIHGTDLNHNCSKMNGFQSSDSRDNLSALVCLLVSCGALTHSKGSFSGNDRKRTFLLDSDAKLVSCSRISGRLGTSSHPFASKDVNGFGTAPIWYQQSMATGPPRLAISL